MSSARQNKEHGVVYTPEPIVDLILDRCQLRPAVADQRLVIDPSCGAGAFLLPVARRIIASGQQHGLSAKQISERLSANLHGADIDRRAIKICRQRLDQLVAEQQLPKVDWQLRVGDSLRRNSDWNRQGEQKFDLVVGNPPYVRIQHLGPQRRQELQEHWPTCQRGAADLFLAFFELGFDLLAPGGYLGYITPRSYFTSEAGQPLRHLLMQQERLAQIIDFGQQQIFEQVTTYTAITIAQHRQRQTGRRKMIVERRSSDWRRADWREKIAASELSDQSGRWLLLPGSDRKFIIDCQQRGPSLGQMSAIRVGLATLADSVYILSLAQEPSDDPQYQRLLDAQGQEQLIERRLLQPLSKVSTMQHSGQDQGLRIIFPYQRHSGTEARPFTEEYFRQNFPRGYQYLQQHAERLAARGHQTKQWFEYGSSQGIQSTFGPKILVPPLTVDGQMFLATEPEYSYFSGYGIFFSGDLQALFQRLQSDDFRRYLRLMGREYRGGYWAINKRLLEKFTLSAQEWRNLGAADVQD